jgi:large subunit ribosomal protein L29
MKPNELREKAPSDLSQMILANMRELFDLRMQKGMGEEQIKPHYFKKIRRSIARIKTILTEKTEKAKTV